MLFIVMYEGMATYVDPLLIERGKGSKVRYESSFLPSCIISSTYS